MNRLIEPKINLSLTFYTSNGQYICSCRNREQQSFHDHLNWVVGILYSF